MNLTTNYLKETFLHDFLYGFLRDNECLDAYCMSAVNHFGHKGITSVDALLDNYENREDSIHMALPSMSSIGGMFDWFSGFVPSDLEEEDSSSYIDAAQPRPVVNRSSSDMFWRSVNSEWANQYASAVSDPTRSRNFSVANFESAIAVPGRAETPKKSNITKELDDLLKKNLDLIGAKYDSKSVPNALLKIRRNLSKVRYPENLSSKKRKEYWLHKEDEINGR